MDNHIEELLPFYALGALTDEERGQVEAYLKEHPEVRAQIEEMEIAASALPYGVSPVEPSDRPKQTLMARIEADQRARSSIPREESRSRATRNWFMRIQPSFISALSLLVAAIALTLMFASNREVSRLGREVAELHNTLLAQTTRVEQLNNALIAQANRLEQLNSQLGEVNAKLPEVTPSALKTFVIGGTEVQPDAHGQLIADPNSQSAVLVVSGLAPLPSGKIYQIWLIEGSTPKSAGLLQVDALGQGVSVLTPEKAIASFDALGISIEPEEGSQQPTGDIVMLSEIN
jgi:anti-sigma-K factor RskA